MNFKKTLAAGAVLAAFAGGACAADVTVYGVIDTGLVYQNTDTDQAGVDDENTFQMKSGVVSGSRFGIKGTEDLGNGLSLGFVLENGFDSDTGALGQGDRLFGREAQVSLMGGFGTLSFGRVGNLNSGNGTFGLTGNLSPFGTTWGDYSADASNVMTGFDRYDNTVTYATPDFSGFKVYAQYSFDADTKDDYDDVTTGVQHGTEGKSSVDRYYALGATYANGPLNLVMVVDQTNYSTKKWGSDVDDSIAVTLGGNYDFGVAKLYAGLQYFDDADMESVDEVSADDFTDSFGTGLGRLQMEGYGLTVGADVPMGGGVFKVATSYMDATVDTQNGVALGADEVDLTRWNTSVGYQYSLSKRTSLYGVASYSYNNVDGAGVDIDPSAIEAAVGLVHKF